jgi:5-methylcytosine-specific restriction endonuclease McrA
MLNRSFVPIHVTSVRRAFNLLYLGIARVVNERYQTYDFQSWADLAVRLHDESIGLVDQAIRVPRVILLVGYDRIPHRQVRFSRYNIYVRDKCTCQYCGRRLPRHQLNLDHVIPRSRGGTSRWDNIVCSCLPCNRRKGGKTPQEAKMKLLRPPFKPKWTPFVQAGVRYREWLPFLSVTDAAYWNSDLSED